MYEIISSVSANRIEADIRTLAGFGTRNTFSDTVSETRGIGAARRWIKAEFDKISKTCNQCLEVSYNRGLVTAADNRRVPSDTWIVNVVAIQRGTKYPNRYIIMSGDIDSRASNGSDATTDAPGANDNASGMAGTIEAARVLSNYSFESSIAYVGLSGEEQGLFGGRILAETATKEQWNIVGILNNDMIGNITGIDGIIDNRTFRIFSEPTPVTESEQQRQRRRFYGGEVDGVSRQLARYVHHMTQTYMPSMNPMMIYRLDRFGRGGHHRPFNDAGFAGIRIMEAHENYTQQHQDIREENGIKYGDVVEHVNFEYASKITAVNAISLAGIAWGPPQPAEVLIGGVVQPSTRLKWKTNESETVTGFKVYWRETTSPVWQYSKYVGNVNEYTLENIVIDNFLFGVASIDQSGNESVVVFPSGLIQRNR